MNRLSVDSPKEELMEKRAPELAQAKHRLKKNGTGLAKVRAKKAHTCTLLLGRAIEKHLPEMALYSNEKIDMFLQKVFALDAVKLLRQECLSKKEHPLPHESVPQKELFSLKE